MYLPKTIKSQFFYHSTSFVTRKRVKSIQKEEISEFSGKLGKVTQRYTLDQALGLGHRTLRVGEILQCNFTL